MGKGFKTFIFIVLLSIFWPVSSFIAAERNKDVMVVAVMDLPPFMIVENGQLNDCINKRILETIVEPMNIKIEYTAAPFKRCLFNMQTGIADVFFGILKNPEREEYMYYVDPPYKTKSNKAFYLRKGSGHRLQKYEDLYTIKRIGVRSGLVYFERFDNDTNIVKEPVTKNIQNLKKLMNNRIDAFIMTETVADYLIKIYNLSDKIEKAPFLFSDNNPAYLAISKKSPFMEHIKDFEESIIRLRNQGKIQEIIDTYLTEL